MNEILMVDLLGMDSRLGMRWRQLEFPRPGPGVQAALAQARPLLMQEAAEMAKSVVGANLARPSPLRGLARR